ncbi:hypothetical protein [Burkholderia cenocepacia]|uniref:hypothetical protein n=1 Tax=Burkholderia cenocepacia TaxID=95486 RepID=UPI0006AC0E5E|nr:hypothetical protein [Burkholderia cenocepacia]KOR22970.1 hypothetical protein ABW54_04035 [Burkholderia cenocepacia]
MKITDDMLTEWFPADVSPVHIGRYLTKSRHGSSLEDWVAYWDGSLWLEFEGGSPLVHQRRIWKGLKEQHHG